MFFWFKKRDLGEIDDKLKGVHKSLEKSFLNVKTDITHLMSRIDLLKEDHKLRNHEITKINNRIDELEIIFNEILNRNHDHKLRVFGQPFGHKQTAVRLDRQVVVVQTAKNDGDLTKKLTSVERAIVNIMLNTDMKLSYEDLSVMLGRDKSTIRGQVNGIKQKSECLINDYVERNGKKRFYITERTKNQVLKERNIARKALIQEK